MGHPLSSKGWTISKGPPSHKDWLLLERGAETLLKLSLFWQFLSIPFSFWLEVRARRMSPHSGRRTKGSERAWSLPNPGDAWPVFSVLPDSCWEGGAFSLWQPLLGQHVQ